MPPRNNVSRAFTLNPTNSARDILNGAFSISNCDISRSSTAYNPYNGETVAPNKPRYRPFNIAGKQFNLIAIEDTSTNLVIQSENFNLIWDNNASSIGSNINFKNINFDEVIEDVSTNNHSVQQNIVSIGKNTKYCLSCYISPKSINRNVSLSIQDASDSNNNIQLIFDTTTHTIIESSAGVGSNPFIQHIVYNEDMGGGVCRVSITFTTNSTLNMAKVLVQLVDGTTINYTGDGESSIFVGGIQLEKDEQTTYIKTTSSTVTRTVESRTISEVDKSNQNGTVIDFKFPIGWTCSIFIKERQLAETEINSIHESTYLV